MSTGVFVLGMHRSGTSATVRAINLLGVPIADDRHLVAASEHNPTGYWEVERLTDFNDELLHALGASATAPPLLGVDWSGDPGLDGLRERARTLFTEVHRTTEWTWKDPRNCVTLPFWLGMLGVRPVVVLVQRNPLEIARSLAARTGISKALSLALWERCLRAALGNARGLPTYVMRYSDLLGDAERWQRDVGAFLVDHGVPSAASGHTVVAAFVEPSLRHSLEPDSALEADPEASEHQRALFEAIERLTGAHDALPEVELGPETPWAEPLLAERRRADQRRLRQRERVERLKRRVDEARAERDRAEALAEESRMALEESAREIDRLRELLGRRDAG